MGTLGCKPISIHMVTNLKLSMNDSTLLSDPTSYRCLVGKLLYLTITRPDLAFSVHVLFQFMDSLCVNHMNAATRVLQYIKSTPGQGILFPKDSNLHLKGYNDSDWGACLDTRKSVTGYCLFLGNNLIS